jgi:hypothetical protein
MSLLNPFPLVDKDGSQNSVIENFEIVNAAFVFSCFASNTQLFLTKVCHIWMVVLMIVRYLGLSVNIIVCFELNQLLFGTFH